MICPSLVLHDRRQRAMQHPGTPAYGQRRTVARSIDALASSLDSNQLHLRVIEKGGESANRVGAAANASDDTARKSALALEHLAAGLVADHSLQVAHQRRIGRGADRGANHVVGALHVCNPIADRRRGGLLERARTRVDRLHTGPEQFHALHIGKLATNVLGAHVDHALKPQESAHGGSGHPMLTGARLGDDPPLAHAPCQQRLAESIVELV